MVYQVGKGNTEINTFLAPNCNWQNIVDCSSDPQITITNMKSVFFEPKITFCIDLISFPIDSDLLTPLNQLPRPNPK